MLPPSVSKILNAFPVQSHLSLAPSAVSLHMIADSVASSDTEQSSVGVSVVTHMQKYTHTFG